MEIVSTEKSLLQLGKLITCFWLLTIDLWLKTLVDAAVMPQRLGQTIRIQICVTIRCGRPLHTVTAGDPIICFAIPKGPLRGAHPLSHVVHHLVNSLRLVWQVGSSGKDNRLPDAWQRLMRQRLQ